MSLINQMLKDLEERRPQPGGALQQELLHNVQAITTDEPRTWPQVVTAVGGGLLLVLLGGFGWWGYSSQVAEAPVVVAAYEKKENPGNYKNYEKNNSQNSHDSQVVTKLVAQSKSKPPPQPQPESAPLPPLVVAPPEVVPVAAVEAVEVAVAVSKVDRPLSPAEQAEAAFLRALAAQRGGEGATMERELRQALEQDPSHFLARETLAALFYRAGRLDEAKEVLRGGMTETSAPISLRKTLARILVDQGDPEGAALALSQGERPPVAQDSEFHQLLAAIYQRTGQFAAAAQTYRQLLGGQHKKGVWWLGLGLALESEHSLPAAKEAYRTALEDPALLPGLGDFARSRLAALATTGGS